MARRRDYKKEYRRRLQLRELREQQLAPVAIPRGKKRRKRDYKAEYERRKYLRLKEFVEDKVAADAKRVFGRKPKRKEERDPGEYEATLQELKRRPERQFEWTDELAFVNAMRDFGLTSRDAYTMWFSP